MATGKSADRLTGISWTKGGSQTLASVAYTLDSVGNRTHRMDQLGTHTYACDNLYRLTSVTYPGPSTDTYTYDAAVKGGICAKYHQHASNPNPVVSYVVKKPLKPLIERIAPDDLELGRCVPPTENEAPPRDKE